MREVSPRSAAGREGIGLGRKRAQLHTKCALRWSLGRPRFVCMYLSTYVPRTASTTTACHCCGMRDDEVEGSGWAIGTGMNGDTVSRYLLHDLGLRSSVQPLLCFSSHFHGFAGNLDPKILRSPVWVCLFVSLCFLSLSRGPGR